MHQARDVRQLHRAVNRGMGGEDLLDQGRAGPRHAHNEDRIGTRATHAAPRLEEFPRADLLLALHGLNQGLRVAVQLRFLESVAARVERKRFLVVAPVLERLGERVTQMVAVGCAGAGLALGDAHRRHVGISQLVAARVGKREAGHRISSGGTQRLAEIAGGLLVFTSTPVQIAH